MSPALCVLQVHRQSCLLQVIAATGVSTYKKAHAVILSGRVRVNGRIVKQPLHLVNPAADEIYIHGSLVRIRQEHRYIVVNKPPGMNCSTLQEIMNSWYERDRNPFEKTQSADEGHTHNHRMLLAGRLDSSSCGLQLMTSDIDWAKRVVRSVEGKHAASSVMRPDYSLPACNCS
jgi:16S rRNA U516 pseudouridylate synthase RsuA-like enzyme